MNHSAPLSHDRSRDWERLRFLVNRAQGSGLTSLDEQELWELPSLYRKAISDLSLLRSTGAAPQLLQELNSLCNRAHGVIYQGAPQHRGASIGGYIARELPRAVRRRKWFVIAAGAVMLFFAVLGWLQCLLQPEMARTRAQPADAQRLRDAAALRARATGSGAGGADPRRVSATQAALMITFNNIRVGVVSFVLGLAGGLPSLIILGSNGYMLGAIAYLYFYTPPGIDVNLPLYFIAGVAPHGAIELPAICLAGAAGMLIGFSLALPRPAHAGRGAARCGARCGADGAGLHADAGCGGGDRGLRHAAQPAHGISARAVVLVQDRHGRGGFSLLAGVALARRARKRAGACGVVESAICAGGYLKR